MRIIKWALFFSVSFLISWGIIATLSQPEFKAMAPARLVTYVSPSVPIYAYVVGAFLLGLAIGLFVALYNFFVLKSQSSKANHRAEELEEELQSQTAQPAAAAKDDFYDTSSQEEEKQKSIGAKAIADSGLNRAEGETKESETEDTSNEDEDAPLYKTE